MANSDILRGHTETVILRILLEGDSYGYEISKKICDVGNGLIEVKDATIYSAFRRMEQDGLINTYWGDGLLGARRRYYSITDEGKTVYEQKKDEWLEIIEILNKMILGGDSK